MPGSSWAGSFSTLTLHRAMAATVGCTLTVVSSHKELLCCDSVVPCDDTPGVQVYAGPFVPCTNSIIAACAIF